MTEADIEIYLFYDARYENIDIHPQMANILLFPDQLEFLEKVL